jgi:predicted DNA binding CopG/RHH family protein
MFGEELQSVTFKVPARKVEAIDRKAARLDVSRSDYLRSLVDKDLATA